MPSSPGCRRSVRVVVGVLHEPGVDLHLAAEDGLEVISDVHPGRNLGGAGGEFGVLRVNTQLLLAGEGLLAEASHPASNGPWACRSIRWAHGAGHGWPLAEVHEERFVGHQRLLLTNPGDSPIRHVLGEVVALLGPLGGSTGAVPS